MLALLLAACAAGAANVTATSMAPADVERQVLIYVYDPAKDTEDGVMQCSVAGLVAITRTVGAGMEGEALIEAVMHLLLAGDLTAEERAHGLTTEFPLEGVTLTDVSLEGGTATVTLDDPMFQTSSGACRVSIINAQVEHTVMQFEEVENVRFLPDELFQP